MQRDVCVHRRALVHGQVRKKFTVIQEPNPSEQEDFSPPCLREEGIDHKKPQVKITEENVTPSCVKKQILFYSVAFQLHLHSQTWLYKNERYLNNQHV